jgi:hypothetical protein
MWFAVVACPAWCGCDRPTEPPRAVAPDVQVASVGAASAPAVAPAAPRVLTWEEIDLPLGAAERFEPWMLKTAVQALDGQRVRITGYMYGDVFQPTNIREFKLVRHVDCKFGAAGHPAHLIFIELGGTLRTAFTKEPMTVEGTFHIRPYTGPDGRTWALYQVDGTKVE